MDPITRAVVAALSSGAISGLTETSKTALSDAYQALKALISKKFGAKSDVVRAMDQLEVKPESTGRQKTLEEEMIAVNAEQDREVLAAAWHLLMLVPSQQGNTGKYVIQNNAPIQQQNVGNRNNNVNNMQPVGTQIVGNQPIINLSASGEGIDESKRRRAPSSKIGKALFLGVFNVFFGILISDWAKIIITGNLGIVFGPHPEMSVGQVISDIAQYSLPWPFYIGLLIGIISFFWYLVFEQNILFLLMSKSR